MIRSDYGARIYDPLLGRWLTMDPLSEKYYSQSPYAYCMNNPVTFVDPMGMDIYRYNDKTGVFHLSLKNNDEFDQVGRFRYDRETDTYTLRTHRNGEARTRIDNIEKGILSDGINFMRNDNMWNIGGQGQPTVEGFQNFAIGFAEMINKEVSGFYFSQFGNPDVISHIYMGRHINNDVTTSYKGRGPYAINPALQDMIQPHTDWHTHPTYGYSEAARTTASPQDRNSKANALKSHSSQRPFYFMILTRGYAPIYY